MMRRWFPVFAAALLATILAAGAGYYLPDSHPAWSAPNPSVERFSRASFDRWLRENRQRPVDFAEFEQFLADQSVAGVVPNWQLLRTDVNDRLDCPRPAFLLPPQAVWPNIIAPLRLLKRDIIPRIGPVEVASSYRTPEFNACVNGAQRSRHLVFAGLDLVTLTERDNRSLFAELCSIHNALGPSSRFGLGAYFDPVRQGSNRRGRFHVDASGYRSWGFSKQAGSSGCLLLKASLRLR